ncbi:hypothetical protein [Streptomyces goshikiensis]|uniref:hypothetical protein n=1 Tax=Streptomyces goshikiensis TaxID=1942 RepID=UPI003676742E
MYVALESRLLHDHRNEALAVVVAVVTGGQPGHENRPPAPIQTASPEWALCARVRGAVTVIRPLRPSDQVSG